MASSVSSPFTAFGPVCELPKLFRRHLVSHRQSRILLSGRRCVSVKAVQSSEKATEGGRAANGAQSSTGIEQGIAYPTGRSTENGHAANGSPSSADSIQRNVYPTEQALENEGLFPLRQPGEFPAPTPVPPPTAKEAPSSFLESISVDFSETAPLDEDAFDPLRDGPLRFLGYSNEVGEAFAAWLPPGGVPFSYAMAISYVFVDTYDKWLKAGRRARAALEKCADLDPALDKDSLVGLVAAERALDTVIWQLIASVAAPGYTIHTIVALTLMALTSLEGLDSVSAALEGVALNVGLAPEVLLQYVNKSVPTGVGLAAIPFIVHPIDNGVHALLNWSLRPAMRRYVGSRGGDVLLEGNSGPGKGHGGVEGK